MRPGHEQRLLLIALLTFLTLASCTTAPAVPTPAAQASPAAKPAGASSPAAVGSPAAVPSVPRPVVGGGAAQPRANPTFAGIGGSAAIIVPTPNFAVQATAVPAPFAQAVSLQTVQPANVVLPVGTLSRIPTAIPGPAGAVPGSAAGPATTGGGSGAAGALLTIGPPITSTPLVRIVLQPQPPISYPPR